MDTSFVVDCWPLVAVISYFICGLFAMFWVATQEAKLCKQWQMDDRSDWAMLASFYAWPVVLLDRLLLRGRLPLIAKLLPVLLLFFAACDAGDATPVNQRWQSVQQTTEYTCFYLCIWESNCKQLPAGQYIGGCDAQCIEHVCAKEDCTATPAGTDDEIDKCIYGLLGNYGECGNAVGMSDTCQAAIFPNS